jgi:hypothetical protein
LRPLTSARGNWYLVRDDNTRIEIDTWSIKDVVETCITIRLKEGQQDVVLGGSCISIFTDESVSQPVDKLGLSAQSFIKIPPSHIVLTVERIQVHLSKKKNKMHTLINTDICGFPRDYSISQFLRALGVASSQVFFNMELAGGGYEMENCLASYIKTVGAKTLRDLKFRQGQRVWTEVW